MNIKFLVSISLFLNKHSFLLFNLILKSLIQNLFPIINICVTDKEFIKKFSELKILLFKTNKTLFSNIENILPPKFEFEQIKHELSFCSTKYLFIEISQLLISIFDLFSILKTKLSLFDNLVLYILILDSSFSSAKELSLTISEFIIST